MDGFEIRTLSLFCNKETREDLHTLKINPVRVVRKADGYYSQFCFDAPRKKEREYTGNVVGLDLGLQYFIFIAKWQHCYLLSIIEKV